MNPSLMYSIDLNNEDYEDYEQEALDQEEDNDVEAAVEELIDDVINTDEATAKEFLLNTIKNLNPEEQNQFAEDLSTIGTEFGLTEDEISDLLNQIAEDELEPEINEIEQEKFEIALEKEKERLKKEESNLSAIIQELDEEDEEDDLY